MNTPEYTVELSILASFPLTEDQLADIAEISGAAGADVGGNRLTTTMTVQAARPYMAIESAVNRVLGIADGVVMSAAALTVEEFDRREAEKAELVGVAEVAAMLGISRQRVTTLSARDDFPAPLVRLKSGPVWRRGDLSTFADGWQRKAGRPRKTEAA